MVTLSGVCVSFVLCVFGLFMFLCFFWMLCIVVWLELAMCLDFVCYGFAFVCLF